VPSTENVAAAPGWLRNLRAARFDRNELAGSLGDLGTFLPLLVGMASQNGLDFASALFFAGLFNLVTGLTFAIPMAVQPMKAIAAIALTEGLTVPQILAAGVMVSAVVLVLGLTGWIEALHRLVPRSVVRGLQLSIGLSLLVKGIQMVTGTHTLLGPDSLVAGALAAAAVLVLMGSTRLPAAIVLFVAGIVLAVVRHPDVGASLTLGITLPHWSPPGWKDFVTAFPKAALPQIPLTTLNSVVAVCALSGDLFPQRPATARRVAISVGAMNLVAAWFGGMPMCHGAGGLAGQYRFGARTNGSILLLGAAKLIAAVLLGSSLMMLCRAFPMSILGVMLAFSGIELALVARDQTARADAVAMIATAGACLALENVALGLAIGLATAWLIRTPGIARPAGLVAGVVVAASCVAGAAVASPAAADSAAARIVAVAPSVAPPKRGGYVQVRETGRAGVGLTATIHRARLSADGALPSGFSYRVLVEFEAAAGAASPSTPSLRETVIRWKRAAWVMSAGQMKTPFTREYLISVPLVETADLAVAIDSLAPKYDIGVQAEYAWGTRGTATLGVFNGEGLNASANRDSIMLVVGRLTATPAPQVALGASVARDAVDSLRWGVDASLEQSGALVRAEYLARRRHGRARDRDDRGWSVLGTYRVVPRAKVLARLEDFARPWAGIARHVRATTVGVDVDLAPGRVRLLVQGVRARCGAGQRLTGTGIAQLQVRF
jgi:hypothetical protein